MRKFKLVASTWQSQEDLYKEDPINFNRTSQITIISAENKSHAMDIYSSSEEFEKFCTEKGVQNCRIYVVGEED